MFMVIVIGIKKMNRWIIFNIRVDIGKWIVFSEELVRMMIFCKLYFKGIMIRNIWINLVICCFLVNSDVSRLEYNYNIILINNC